MLERATAIEFVREAKQGRTGPAILTCECADGELVEVFCKVSAGCDHGVSSLAREVVGACLAADLGLPIPKPYLVDLSDDFIAAVPDGPFRQKLDTSSNVGFGSLRVPNQFSVWTKGHSLTDTMVPEAAAIMVFDAIIQNPDRRESNPNCLVRGGDLRIFDHELAFMTDQILVWVPPWKPGGLRWIEQPGAHIFFHGLKNRDLEVAPIEEGWTALANERISDYGSALPESWAEAEPAIIAAQRLIRDARDNFAGCLTELERVMS